MRRAVARTLLVTALCGRFAFVLASDDDTSSDAATSTTTTTTTTWVRPTETSFMRLGSGECLAPASRSVRGISRRDIDHGSCRQHCSRDVCLGYSYAPCERICVVYGDGLILMNDLDPTEQKNWTAINGWGAISHPSGRCGSSCFLRANPCFSGQVRSAGATIQYTSMSFKQVGEASCPGEYRGKLSLRCGISGVEVLAGRCLKACPKGWYNQSGFEVPFEKSRHGDFVSGECPPGTQGTITMKCIDGDTAYAYGACGYVCSAGSMRCGSGIVMYPKMDHQTELDLSCPTNWTGSPRLRCHDKSVTVAQGRCDRHCSEGALHFKVGNEFGSIPHGVILHGSSLPTTCPEEGFAGDVVLECSDGTVVMNEEFGRCHRHCPAGEVSSGPLDALINERRNVSHGKIGHGNTTLLTCNPGFYTYPTDKLFVVGSDDHMVFQSEWDALSPDGDYGTVVNEYQLASSVAIEDGMIYVASVEDGRIYRLPLSTITPTSLWQLPISETLHVSYMTVADGVVYAVGTHDQRVYKQALADMKSYTEWEKLCDEDRNVTAITVLGDTIYVSIWEEKRIYFNAGLQPFGNWSGPISTIYNLKITGIHALEGKFYILAAGAMYYNNISAMNNMSSWVGPLGNSHKISAMTTMMINRSLVEKKWVPGFVGELSMECNDGSMVLLDGACKMHCDAGVVISNGVIMHYDNMTHGSNVTMICPPTHTGVLITFCDDGRTYSDGYCGPNCPGVTVDSNTANVTIPDLNHDEDKDNWFNITCPAPYTGYVLARCFMGELRWEGICYKACPADVFKSRSATIAYPALNHTGTFTGPCVAIFKKLSYTGNVSFTCVDGEMVNEGGCYPDCTPGTISNNGVKINYGLINSGLIRETTCEPNDMYGTVNIECDRGSPVVYNGTCGMPCWSSIYTGAFTKDYDLVMPDIGHQKDAWVTCPPEVSGRLRFNCWNKYLTVIGGSCGERCFGQSLKVYGANFMSPMLEHLESYVQPCMTPYYGEVLVHCNDGILNVTSKCQQGCFEGNVTIDGGAMILYPDLITGETFKAQCPFGYTGEVTMECGDAVPFAAEGACHKECKAARYTFESLDFSWDVDYPIIKHGESYTRGCKDSYFGNVTFTCNMGTASMSAGGCFRGCGSGVLPIRQGIMLRYPDLEHDELTEMMPCPSGFVGAVQLVCVDSQVRAHQGDCWANCKAGQQQGADHPAANHTHNMSVVCPEVGSLELQCLDGGVVVTAGECLYGCPAGSIVDDTTGATIQYDRMEHLGKIQGTCSGDRIGVMQVNCSNTEVTVDELPGQQCYKHCVSGFNLTTTDGTHLSDDSNVTLTMVDGGDMKDTMLHEEEITVDCPTGHGFVTLRCDDGDISIIAGSCGPENCAEREMSVGAAQVDSPEMNDGTLSAIPSQCPGEFLGETTFSCTNSTVRVTNVTLEYPAIVGLRARDFNASNYSEDWLLDHEDERFELCGCCIPVEPPVGAEPIAGVDLRKIIVWAAGVAAAGILLAGIFGGIALRPDRFRRKKGSRVHAGEEEEVPEQLAIVQSQPTLAMVRASTFQWREEFNGEIEPHK